MALVPEQFPKTAPDSSAKNCDKNKKLEPSDEGVSEAKTVLVIDTVTDLCACALYQDEVCLARQCDELGMGHGRGGHNKGGHGRGHGEHLIGQIEKLLRQADIAKTSLNLIAVNTGPGSFTGMRVGVAVARALALALGVKAVGVNRFEAIEHGLRQASPLYQGRGRAVILPAVQGLYSIQIFATNGAALTAAHQATIDEIAAQLPQPVLLGGEGCQAIIPQLKTSGLTCLEFHDLSRDAQLDAINTIARGSAIARLAPSSQASPSPLYMRAPDAKLAAPQIEEQCR